MSARLATDGAPRDGSDEARQIDELKNGQRGRVEDGYAAAAGRGLVVIAKQGEWEECGLS